MMCLVLKCLQIMWTSVPNATAANQRELTAWSCVVVVVVVVVSLVVVTGATTGGRKSKPPPNLDGPPTFLRSFLMNRV